MKKTHLIVAIILSVLSLGIIAFIFYNSSLSAIDSASDSLDVLGRIISFFKSINIDLALTDRIIRKCAHFIEFFMLGTTVYLSLYFYDLSKVKRFIFTLSTGLLVAIIDEHIQLGSLGRSCELRDMCIDFSGVLLITLIFTLIFCLIERRHHKSNG